MEVKKIVSGLFLTGDLVNEIIHISSSIHTIVYQHPALTFPYKRSPAQQKAASHFCANMTDGLFNAQQCKLKTLFLTCGPGEASSRVPASPSFQCACSHTKIICLTWFGKTYRKDPVSEILHSENLFNSTGLAGISVKESQFFFFFKCVH